MLLKDLNLINKKQGNWHYYLYTARNPGDILNQSTFIEVGRCKSFIDSVKSLLDKLSKQGDDLLC